MKNIVLGCFMSLILLACGGKQEAENKEKQVEMQVVNVYSHRHYPSDEELFKKFTEQTGIEVNVVKANADQLMQRIESEGENSPADILLTVDAGRLYRAKSKGILQPVTSDLLTERVPAGLKDSENFWYGMTIRARLIAYSKDRVKPTQLSTMQDLTDPKWKGKVLVRQSNNIYNQSLLASMIMNDGEEEAKKWAEGIVANMARSPKGNDRDQMKEIVKGTGDVAIVNSYYYGMLLNADNQDERKVGEQIAVFFPNQDGVGTHINISGAGVAKFSPNKENAILFLEYLVSQEAQEVFASTNYEFPVNPNVKPSKLLKSWGTFKADTLDFNKLGELNAEAVKTFDMAGWE
ncbi:MAG: iron(III) transport system substrate-binding protein [Flammeovirgaceae bacterium]|jgi:iron(III) transport system substrate-binding protein